MNYEILKNKITAQLDDYDKGNCDLKDLPIFITDIVKEQEESIPMDAKVKPEIAVDVINKEMARLEKLAGKYKDEMYIESYIDCLSNRNVLKNILTKIEKQFSV